MLAMEKKVSTRNSAACTGLRTVMTHNPRPHQDDGKEVKQDLYECHLFLFLPNPVNGTRRPFVGPPRSAFPTDRRPPKRSSLVMSKSPRFSP